MITPIIINSNKNECTRTSEGPLVYIGLQPVLDGGRQGQKREINFARNGTPKSSYNEGPLLHPKDYAESQGMCSQHSKKSLPTRTYMTGKVLLVVAVCVCDKKSTTCKPYTTICVAWGLGRGVASEES